MEWAWGPILDACSLTTAWALGRRRRWGWLVSCLSMALWSVFAVMYGQWGFFPGILLHVYFAIRGYALWGRSSEDGPALGTG
jgi:hypothetical protein